MINLIVADESYTAEVATLIAALFEEVEHSPDAETIAEIFADVDSDDRHSTLLAVDDESSDVVGVLTVSESIALYAGGYIGVLNELYVLPEFRSAGVGKMLLDFAKEVGESRGWKRLEVTTPGAEFERTVRFYGREGFHQIGPRMKYEF